ncbi:PREDICTED: uncharacterized protein LOC109205757 [Nicotiana attenuata]|uniref:uncharacterized protein LOC109205757 n=1 Tax=Nicotiana attenuata TaxID=49451 RepID=UPI0009051A6A|nr:PREDICTED: uncharacterized protein LOC109205757 [Nicotiana attenuata]
MSIYIDLKWNKIASPELFVHEEGYFIIKFQSIDDMKEILCSGPYTINSRPIILKPWTPEFDFDKEFPTEIPLWIKLPKLPMNCWGINSLSRISSAIGIPMYADECTAKQKRVSFDRMLVEVNVTKPLPDQIEVMDPNGRVFQQPILYDWKPLFCEKCQVIGHECPKDQRKNDEQPAKQEGHKRIVLRWVTKEQPKEQQDNKKNGENQEVGTVVRNIEIEGKHKQAGERQSTGLMQDQKRRERNDIKAPDKGKDKVPELNLQEFPILCSVPTKNVFAVLNRDQGGSKSAPPDKGGGTSF